MLVARTTQRKAVSPMLQMLSPGGARMGKLGVDWPLVLQVGGWIITGVGLGMSVYDSITSGAKEANVKPGDLSDQDIAALASTIAAKDPQGRSAQQWQQDLTAMLGSGATTIPQPQLCPAGFVRDPATGACLPLQKAGFFQDLSTGELIAIGVGGLVLAKVLKLI